MSRRLSARGWVTLGPMPWSMTVILTDEQVVAALAGSGRARSGWGRSSSRCASSDEGGLLTYLGAQFRRRADHPVRSWPELDLDVVKLIPRTWRASTASSRPSATRRRLIVATADPLNVVAIDDLRRATGLEIDFAIGPGSAIQEAIERTYRRMISTEGIDEALRQDLGLSVRPAAGRHGGGGSSAASHQADDPPVVKVVNYVLGPGGRERHRLRHSRGAARGSDTRVALSNQTGCLFDLLEVRRSLHLAVVSRLKIISRLDIASGGCLRTAASPPGSTVGRSTSASPRCPPSTARGRAWLLERRWCQALHAGESGLRARSARVFHAAGIRRPWGMVLLTGPTGSGEVHHAAHRASRRSSPARRTSSPSRTRWSTGSRASSRCRSRPTIGFDFARSLRSILRQDPDIISDRRDPRPGDGADRGAGDAHRPPRAHRPCTPTTRSPPSSA